VFWLAVLAIIAGCERQPIDRTEDIGDENKALVRRWIEEGFNRQNLAVVDELIAEQFSVNGQTIGRDGLRMSMSRYLMGFPDLRVTIDDILAEGSKGGFFFVLNARNGGPVPHFKITETPTYDPSGHGIAQNNMFKSQPNPSGASSMMPGTQWCWPIPRTASSRWRRT